MRFGLIDLLFAIACIAIGMVLGQTVASGLPTVLRAFVGAVAGVGLYLVLIYPLYRGLRLLPMILPRCPCCRSFQPRISHSRWLLASCQLSVPLLRW